MPYFPPVLIAAGTVAGAVSQKQDMQQGVTFTGIKSTPGTRESYLFDSANVITFTYATVTTQLKAAIDGLMTFAGVGGANAAVFANNWDLRIQTTGNMGNLGAYSAIAAGASFLVRTLSPFNGTISGEFVGAQFQVAHTAGAGTISGAMAGIQIRVPGYTAGGTVSGIVRGIRVANQGNAAWATSEGIFVDTQSGSTNSYALRLTSGLVNLGSGNFACLGATPAAQQAGGAQTAGAAYTATEQDMLQKIYNMGRTFGFLA